MISVGGVWPDALDAALMLHEVVRDVFVHDRQVTVSEAFLEQTAGGDDVVLH